MTAKRLLAVFALALLAAASMIFPATAQTNKGLRISPLRSYLKINDGEQQSGSFTVTNLTENPITASLSVKNFSVSDYSYNYKFTDTRNNWISLERDQVDLKPNASQKINYVANIPQDSAPGGHYYTLFASAELSEKGVRSTVQAATLVYLTVNGKLIKTGSIEKGSMPRLVFGDEIPYKFTAHNTGNVHYFTYVSGKLNGLFTSRQTQPVAHLLMPDTVRDMAGSLKSPVLPGFYHASYGYKTDAGDSLVKSQYILFIPPWFIAALGLIALAAYTFKSNKKRSNQ